jgi:hypothetical protein
MIILTHLDLVLLAVALPLFAVAGLPMVAWLIVAAAWLIQRWVRAWAMRRAKATDDPRTLVGLLAGSLLGRGWFIAIAIFACGMVFGDKAGLCAAVLSIAMFTLMFTFEMVFRGFEEGTAQ